MINYYSPPDKSDIIIPDVLAHIRGNSLLFTARSRLYVYNEAACCFSHIPKDELPRFVLGFISPEIRKEVRTSALNEIVKRLLVLSETDVDLNEIRKSVQHLINLRNGVYDLKERKLIPRAGIPRDQHLKHCFTSCMDFDYISEPKIENAVSFLRFLKSSLDYDTDPAKTGLLLEMIGVCLSGIQFHRHMYILMGVTGSGKSVIADFLHRIVIPESAVTNFGLQEIAGRFNKQHLENAVLNICREITARRINDTDTIKELIAEEPVFVEGKGKEGYTAYPHVKLFSCTNQLPRFGNMDASGNLALMNRMVVLRFNHTIPDDEADRELSDKLFNERNIICSLAIKELQRLYDSGFTFTVPEDTKLMMDSYHREDISLELFIKQNCRISADSKVHKRDFMSAYTKFCSDNFFVPYKQKEVVQYIDANLPSVRSERFKLNSRYLWGWVGIEVIEIKEDDENE